MRWATTTLAAATLAAPSFGFAEITVGLTGDYATIQEAIDVAVNGDSIRVQSDFYDETIDFLGKDIRVYSEDDDPTLAVISGLQQDSVVKMLFSSGSLEGFTVRGGESVSGGGILMILDDDDDPLVRNCLIYNNRALFGAGINVSGGSPRFEDLQIHNNVGLETAPPGFANGGGVKVDESFAAFVDCVIEFNETPGEGGGVFVIENPDQGFDGALFRRCEIRGNAAARGGGIAARGATTVEFLECEIVDNDATRPPLANSTNEGGGAFTGNACPRYRSCLFAGNRAGDGSPGRIGKGGGLYEEGFATIQSVDPPVPCETVVDGCTFVDNDAGGGSANVGYGGGVCCDNALTYMRNSIYWGNTANSGDGEQIAVLNTFVPPTPPLQGTFLTTSFCDLEGGAAAVHEQIPAAQNYDAFDVIAVDPLFVGGGDYHLTASSPCIAAGDPGIVPEVGERDIDGDPRLLGTRTDMGMDEFVDCNVLTFYGPLTPHSAGPGTTIGWSGSTSVSANDATLTVSGAPPGVSGIFFVGPNQIQRPMGMGNILLGPTIRINPVVHVDANGNASRAMDWTLTPFDAAPVLVQPGASMNFQFWHRDGQETNLSNAVHVTFCP